MLRYACVLLMVAAAACSPAVKGTQESGVAIASTILDPYLKIQEALAADSLDQVKANAGNLATAATALGGPAMKIDTAAVQLTAVDDLASARDRFGALSDALVDYMQGFHLSTPEGVRLAFCPMVNKPWLQRGDTLSNPYYGKDMLTCGEFR